MEWAEWTRIPSLLEPAPLAALCSVGNLSRLQTSGEGQWHSQPKIVTLIGASNGQWPAGMEQGAAP